MSTFYQDHWVSIEEERLQRYDQMFQFRAREQEPILTALSLAGAGSVLDFGCGPGYMTEEIAGRVDGSVVGFDLNAEFVKRATDRTGDVTNLSYVNITGESLPAEDATFDRVLVKNVLEYVPDINAVLGELLRVMQPGGQILIVDSDWGFVIVEPWGKQVTDAFFEAAAAAFKEPYIGRKVSGALSTAGFSDVRVKMMAAVDLKGWGLNVLNNMRSYILQFGTMAEADLDAMFAELDRGLEDGTFMFVLPQFYVTARKGE